MKKLLFTLLILPFLSSAQTDSLALKADELLTAYAKQDKFAGAVLIAKDGKVVFEKGYGFANREKNLPNTPQTEFRIGSLTKSFTATLIMQLHEKGKLSIHDPISKYIPDYPKGDSIRIENLLNHTSGIVSITSMKAYYETWMKEVATPVQSISRFKNEPLRFAPGSKFDYSNSNYILLSHIAEKASGKSFKDLLTAQLTSKAGMKNSGMDETNRTSELKAKGYQATPDAEYGAARFVEMSVLTGAGAMFSTLKDLYQYDRALYGKLLLSEVSKKQMFTPGKGDYGYGWEITRNNGRTEISHTGQTDGFQANMIRYPEEDICIIYLSNYMDSKGPQISKALTALVFNEPYELPKEHKMITLDPAVYNRYTGKYVMEKGPALFVAVEDGKLKARLETQPFFTLLPESETRFFVKKPEAEVEFTKDPQGKVEGITLSQGKKSMSWKKAE